MSSESDLGPLRYGIESTVRMGDYWQLEDYIFTTKRAARIQAIRLTNSDEHLKYRPVRVRLVRVTTKRQR